MTYEDIILLGMFFCSPYKSQSFICRFLNKYNDYFVASPTPIFQLLYA